MATYSVGLGAPRLVHSCIIKNNSDSDVQVRVIFDAMANQGQDVNSEIYDTIIPVGGMSQAEERIMDNGSFQIRKTIYSIEVTRANGETQNLTAPFNGVHGIELDWNFVIDNNQIHSVKGIN